MNNLSKYLTLLEEPGLGLLLTSRYSRHYGAQCDIAEGVAIVTKAGCRYFTDSRYIEAAQKGISGFEVLEVNMHNSYTQRLLDAIRDFGIAALGYEEHSMTAGELLRYQETLGVKLIPMDGKINSFRSIKEPWELERMQKAQDITDEAFSKVLKRIHAGMTEKEVQAELIYCLYACGGEGLSFDPIVVSGPNTSLPHGVATDRVIEPGDFITMDFGVIWHGYCSDMTRTVAVGYATEEMKKVYDTVLKAQLAGIAAIRAGATGQEVDGAARKVIADAGYGEFFGHSFGHSLGLEVHENPGCSPRNPEPVAENVVTSAEPGIYLPEKFGVRIEDVLIFRENGSENLTHSPKELIII